MSSVSKQEMMTIPELFEIFQNLTSTVILEFDVNMYNFNEYKKLYEYINGPNYRIPSSEEVSTLSIRIKGESFIEGNMEDKHRRSHRRVNISFCEPDEIIDFLEQVKTNFELLTN